MTYEIRALNTADAEDYRRVRLDALRLHPEAFAASFEAEAVMDRAGIVERLCMPGFTRFGAFDGQGALVGLVGLQVRPGAKERHKARLFSMYVDAAHRGGGVARQLVAAVIAGAREAGAIVLQLAVTAGNAPARRLYESLGFQTYGIERRALLVDGVLYDDELMALDLD